MEWTCLNLCLSNKIRPVPSSSTKNDNQKKNKKQENMKLFESESLYTIYKCLQSFIENLPLPPPSSSSYAYRNFIGNYKIPQFLALVLVLFFFFISISLHCLLFYFIIIIISSSLSHHHQLSFIIIFTFTFSFLTMVKLYKFGYLQRIKNVTFFAFMKKIMKV